LAREGNGIGRVRLHPQALQRGVGPSGARPSREGEAGCEPDQHSEKNERPPASAHVSSRPERCGPRSTFRRHVQTVCPISLTGKVGIWCLLVVVARGSGRDVPWGCRPAGAVYPQPTVDADRYSLVADATGTFGNRTGGRLRRRLMGRRRIPVACTVAVPAGGEAGRHCGDGDGQLEFTYEGRLHDALGLPDACARKRKR
jgi:hypothetical protein